MKTQNIFKRIVLAAFLLASTMLFGGAIFSQPSYAAGDSSYRLQISPSQEAFGTLQPGAIYEGTFNVQNPGTKPYSYTLSLVPYNVSGQNYAQDFATTTAYNQILDWIQFENGEEGTVQPNSENKIVFRITVPEDAPAGTQRAAIMVTMKNDADLEASGVQTVNQAAYFFYGNIDGDTRTTAEIISNKIPGFLFNPPILATSVVKNTGNIYTEARYKIEIFNFFGGQEVYSNVKFEDGEEVVDTYFVFPETERYSEIAWEGTPPIGIFKVRQTVSIFDESSYLEKVVIVCPIWLLVLILMFIAAAVFWIVSRISQRKNG